MKPASVGLGAGSVMRCATGLWIGAGRGRRIRVLLRTATPTHRPSTPRWSEETGNSMATHIHAATTHSHIHLLLPVHLPTHIPRNSHPNPHPPSQPESHRHAHPATILRPHLQLKPPPPPVHHLICTQPHIAPTHTWKMRSSWSTSEFPGSQTLPSDSSRATHPRAHMSAEAPYFVAPNRSSGERYQRVKT